MHNFIFWWGYNSQALVNILSDLQMQKIYITAKYDH